MKFFLLLCLSSMVTMMSQAQESKHQLNSRRLYTSSSMNSQPLQNTRRTFPLGGYGYGGLGGGVGGGLDAGVSAGIDAGLDAGIGAGVGGYGYGGLGGVTYGGYPYYG